MLRFALVSFLSCTLGCATETTDDTLPGGGGKADGSSPVITFKSNFTQTVSGELLAGSSVEIKYDLARLPSCRGSTGGSEVWGVTGFVQFDTSEPKSFAVSELRNGRVVPKLASVEIPGDAKLASFWFQVTNRWGCSAYDSNHGDNYDFAVETPTRGAVLSFDADYTQSQSQTLHAADRVIVHYDPQRLAECEASTSGHVAWGVTGYYQIDGANVHELRVAQPTGTTLTAADPAIVLPRGRDLALWFEATNIYGCHAYDSSFGDNYHFAIE